MTDKEIEKWTEKSKTGLLSKDSDISKFLQEMRAVLYSKVEGVPMLSDIGIESSKEWKDYGKLTIDKDKLTETLENDMQSVASVFTGKNGVASRLEGACKRAANTSSGSPGSLVTLAGVKGKATEKENTITDRIDTIKEKIEKLKEHREQEISASLTKLNNDIYQNEKGLSERDRVYLVAASIIATLGVPGKVAALEKSELKSSTERGLENLAVPLVGSVWLGPAK